jgi:hypothetical protein
MHKGGLVAQVAFVQTRLPSPFGSGAIREPTRASPEGGSRGGGRTSGGSTPPRFDRRERGALSSSPPLGVWRVSANPPHAALFARPRWRSLHRTAPISDASWSSKGTGASTPCRPPASVPCTPLARWARRGSPLDQERRLARFVGKQTHVRSETPSSCSSAACSVSSWEPSHGDLSHAVEARGSIAWIALLPPHRFARAPSEGRVRERLLRVPAR